MTPARGLLVIALATITGCNLLLEPRSPAPPGRVARLDEWQGFFDISYRIEVSRGVALAIACTSGCANLHVTTDDAAIAEGRPALLGTVEHTPWGTRQPPSALVVVGKAAGTTVLHVASGKHHRDIPVRVIAAPGPALAGTP
jgi:hypothetical protein